MGRGGFRLFPRTGFSVAATNFSNYVIMAAVTYAWLRYVMAVEQAPHRERRINKFAVLFPFLVSTVLLLLIWFTAPQKLVSDTLEVLPLVYVFLVTVPYIYILAVIFYAVRRAKTEEDPAEKRKHLYVGFFPLIVILGGLIEMLFMPDTPVFCFSCTILMLIFYLRSMETQISTDPLTQLNNRGQLLRYVSQGSNLRMEGKRSFVVMVDVNDFKLINDTYGHAEGDRALVLLAESLKDVVSSHKMPIFLGRFGGDEFVLIVHAAGGEEVEGLIRDIRLRLETACREADAPYILSIGAGFDELLDSRDSFQKCMQRADQNLYLDKEACKKQGRSTVRLS